MEIGVYGLGRFGSFWASLLSQKFTVKGYNRNQNRTIPQEIIKADEDEVTACKVIFLCVAISSMEEVLHRIKDRLSPGTLIMDTCSVKVYPVELMEKILKADINIIGTHPMFGPDSGKAGVKGLPLVYCPVRGNDDLFKEWLRVFESFGLKVATLPANAHDKEVAYTQGITHFIGRVLDDLRLKESPMSTLGYTKLLEIIEQTCNDPMKLFLDLQRYNPYTREMREDLQRSITEIMKTLQP